MAAAEELRADRRAALTAAAALTGPTVPGGILDRHPDEAATVVTRMASMFLPWLESGRPLPVPERLRKRAEAAATAAGAPGTGEEDGPNPEAEHASARAQEDGGN